MSVYLGTQKIGRANVLRIDRYSEGYNVGYNDAMEGINAIRTNVSGNPIYINDMVQIVQPLDVTLSSTTLIDFTNIPVTRVGKNLLHVTSENSIANSYNYRHFRLVEGGIEFDGGSLVGIKMRALPSHQYTVSFDTVNEAPTRDFHLRIYQSDVEIFGETSTVKSYSVRNLAGFGSGKPHVNFNTSATTNWIMIYFYTGATASGGQYDEVDKIYAHNIQVENGGTATLYAPYSGQIAYADETGSVKGLTSIAPEMQLICYNPDVTINVQYYRDTQIALANQILEIAMSGGN